MMLQLLYVNAYVSWEEIAPLPLQIYNFTYFSALKLMNLIHSRSFQSFPDILYCCHNYCELS